MVFSSSIIIVTVFSFVVDLFMSSSLLDLTLIALLNLEINSFLLDFATECSTYLKYSLIIQHISLVSVVMFPCLFLFFFFHSVA